MKLKLLLIICAVFFMRISFAQTFTGAGGAIPDSGAVQGIYPITVTGIGIINNNFGLSSVCINATHTWLSDLEIYLLSPDGNSIPLSIQNGGSGNNYTGTCFTGTATVPLEDGMAPFIGNYIPDGYMGMVNNGQNANGIWSLYIKDISPGQTGNLIDWSINFSHNLPASPPPCNGNLPPANTCDHATAICSFSGFCSATSSTFTADSWPELDNAFCGTVQNNAFLKFVAVGTFMDFSIWVTSSIHHDGIQMLFYDGGCGSGAVTEYGCYSPIRPGSSPNIITAAGLTPGNTYYLMIDGYAGDECNYVIELYPPIGGLAVSAASPAICEGKSVQLTATGGNGIYAWSGPGLNTQTGNTVIATPDEAATYYVSSIDPGGLCAVTKQVSIEVMRLPDPPSIEPVPAYCKGSIALPLQATGNTLLWYTTPSGGTGSNQASVPSTANAETITYYVSQHTVCESKRIPVNVIIKERPDIGPDKNKTICNGKLANLTNIFNEEGLQTAWTFNSLPITPPLNAAVAGSYQLEVTGSNGCTDTGRIQLIIQAPVHVLIDSDTLAIKGIPFNLHCSTASTYWWEPAGLVNFPNSQHPSATIINDQQFIVKASDAAGCEGNDTILVKVYNANTYFIPNAFTPNGDGKNDIFRAIPVGIDHTEIFKIINRYGKIIFETRDPYNKGWDGTYLGAKQFPGTYVWLIKGIDKKGKKIEMRGTVILVQ